MKVAAIFYLLVAVSTTAAASESIVASLSQNRVALTANFDGSEIFVFGAVKRIEPAPDDGNLDVIITVAGPREPVTVRRKRRVFGVWANAEAVEVDLAPSFYAIATTGPLEKILNENEDGNYKISAEKLVSLVDAPEIVSDAADFTEALIGIRKDNGLYFTTPVRANFSEDTLIGARFALPANLLEGDYVVRIFLVRNGDVIDTHRSSIAVRKVGLQRWIYNLAHQLPLIYGFLCVFLAISAGWIASILFRPVR